MIFWGKILSEISNDEIKQLVFDHINENQNLEYKLTINYKCIDDKYEVLCDIVSLVNAGGGYLIIGIRDDGNGKALRFESVEEPDRLVRSIKDLCVEHISERIEGIEWEIRDIDDNNIVIYRIPESTRVPHMVTIKNNTHFLTRSLHDKPRFFV